MARESRTFFFQDDEHLAEGASQHVEVSDGRVFAAVGGVEQAVEEKQRTGAVVLADGVGELVERTLLGGEDEGLHVAEVMWLRAMGAVGGCESHPSR